MKLKKYTWLAALPMIFAACQDDVLVENQQQDKIYTLSAVMNDGTAMSRAQIQLGNEDASVGEIFLWNEGDSFKMYQNVNDVLKVSTFEIDDNWHEEGDGEKTTAVFSSETPADASVNYIAIYPSSVPVDELNDAKFNPQTELDFTSADEETVWKNYFKDNMFMMAEGQLSADGNNRLSFRHLCSLFRFTYTNRTDDAQVIEGISLGGGQTLGTSKSICVTGGRSGSGSTNSYEVRMNGLSVEAGDSTDLYIFVFPEGFGNGNLDIAILRSDENGGNKGISIPVATIAAANNGAEGFEAGKRYWFDITETGNGLIWSASYSEDDEVETPTVETHTATVTDFIGLRDALAVNAQRTVINFDADIKLDTPLSINCSTTFNMNGKTISLHESNYKTNGMNAVFNVSSSLEVNEGKLEGRSGEKLHDYYFNLSGTRSGLDLKGTTLNTGSAVQNGVYMDDDGIALNHIWTSDTDSISSSITTSGYAIYYVAKQATDARYSSNIEGDITGNVYIETQYTEWNGKLIFKSGTINGNLETNSTGPDVAEAVLKASNVTIGSGCTGWDAAGLYVEDQCYYVTTFDELKNALEAARQADENTYIYFWDNVEMTEPVVINKPVEFHLIEKTLSLSSSFNWGTADAAITNTTGKLTIYGRGNGTGIDMINGTISGSTTETGKYLIKSSSNELRLEAVTIAAEDSLNAILVENNDLYTQGKYETYISAGEGCYAVNMLAESSSANIWLMKETHIEGNVGFALNCSEPSGIADTSNDRLSTIKGDLIVEGAYANSLIVDVNTSNVTGNNWPANNTGGIEGGDIDPDAKQVGTLQELQDALTWDGPIYLTQNIELTSPLVVENIGKPIFMNGKTISMSSDFAWGDADAVITSKSAGLVILGGTLKGLETDQTIAKSFFKVIDNGSLQLENGAYIRANAIQNAIYVLDANCRIDGNVKISSDGCAVNMEANKCCDVYIYNCLVEGNIRLALNNSTYSSNKGDANFCRFGVGSGCKITGDLIIEGTYKDTATGYSIEKEATADISGNGWD